MVTAESTSTQTRLIQDWAQHWTSHDIDSLVSLFTDELIYEDVPLGVVNRDKQQLRAFVEGFVRGYPDITVELTSSFAVGDHGAAEWVIRGTHLGDRPGRPATGKPIALRGASVFRFADGKIRSCVDYSDLATLLKQIGMMPAS
jgi:steroid delta-isomerase-like uncharacterized protein